MKQRHMKTLRAHGMSRRRRAVLLCDKAELLLPLRYMVDTGKQRDHAGGLVRADD